MGFVSYGQNNDVIEVSDSLEVFLSKSKKFRTAFKIKESLDYAIKTIDLAHQLNSDEYICKGHYLMVSNYEVIEDYKNMEFHSQEALKYARKAKDTVMISYSLNALGGVYSDGLGEVERGMDYFNQSLEVAERVKDKSKEFPPVLNIGWIYIKEKEFDQAFPYLKKAEKLTEDHAGSFGIVATSHVKYLLGRYYIGKEQYERSHRLLNEAIKNLEGINVFSILNEAYKAKAEAFEKVGNADSALYSINKHLFYRDKLLDEEKLQQIEVAKLNFNISEFKRELEANRREKEYLAKIDKRNIVITITSISLILLLAGILFVFYGYSSKKKLNKVLEERNEELIKAKAEAEKLTNTKSQFISTVSHELRTPLYGVVGITTLLLEENDIPAKHKKLLNSLKFSGDYLLDLINKVLKISKIESNNEKLTRTPTNLLQLSKNLLYSFEYQAKNKNNELILQIPDELPDVLSVDSLKVSEVLINLIGNSTKFTENGKIWLRIKIISLDKDMITIRYEIEDNGVGIPEDKKEFVFEKFSQVGREFNKAEGTGLGLSIVKNLLEMMDSEIHLDSKEGRGTRFYFDLELEVINEKEEQDIDTNADGINAMYRRILVAEDNKINQIVTKNLLNIIGYDCTIVENGFNAVQMVQKEDFDLILMDLNMPYLNGTEATRRIREFDQTTPIIALTASELSEIEEECMAIGMNDIINKPLNKNDLKNIITKHLLR
ncbi:tetratricopeptide repeat-containing hybrid sensor histidine kinase/response regulator [Aquimarina algiphila]|uniref:tetratricopeptide repeat-containing hybrid sensor histidine kinase/response regulator n=1 Tax=Aquimarina algiphila TaxID=2047982 RepID=UPI0024906D9F|nr:response regulator [Aquimarina algiphila]